MVIAFKRNTLIVSVRQLNMVEISLAVSLGEFTMLKQTNSSKADIVYNLIYAIAYTNQSPNKHIEDYGKV